MDRHQELCRVSASGEERETRYVAGRLLHGSIPYPSGYVWSIRWGRTRVRKLTISWQQWAGVPPTSPGRHQGISLRVEGPCSCQSSQKDGKFWRVLGLDIPDDAKPAMVNPEIQDMSLDQFC